MDLLINFAIVSLVLFALGSWLWRRSRARSARRWPTVEGTIESGTLEVVARERFVKVKLPVFAFSYKVGGKYFAGSFALLPYITDPGPLIIERMIGRKLQVRYDPQKAENWFIPEKLIEGCKVEQKFSPDLLNFKPTN